MNLECSTKGDPRFSAFNAIVEINGVTLSVEEHYQFSKVFDINGFFVSYRDIKYIKHIQHKGTLPKCFCVNGILFGLECLPAWYKSLWYKYLGEHLDLVTIASHYDTFSDQFSRPNSFNNQAKVIDQYVKHGRSSIYKDCEQFFNLYKLAIPNPLINLHKAPVTNKIPILDYSDLPTKILPEFKLVIAGSRQFNNYQLLCETIDHMLSIKSTTHKIVIISGTANGADRYGEQYGKERGYEVRMFPADWNGMGKKAGFIRNKQMADTMDAAVLFWDGVSPGTKHMIDICKAVNKPTKVIKY